MLPDYVYYYTKTNLYRRFIDSLLKQLHSRLLMHDNTGNQVVIPRPPKQICRDRHQDDEQKALVKRARTRGAPFPV